MASDADASVFLRLCGYPMLGVGGFVILMLGFGHVFFCFPTYFLVLPIVDAIVILVSVFHGIFLKYPNRCHFALQCVSLTLAAMIFLTTTLELFCLPSSGQQEHQGALCYGVDRRTANLSSPCRHQFFQLRHKLLRAFDTTEINMLTIIAGGLAILSLLQVAFTSGLAWWSAVECGVRVRAHYWQVPLGVAISLLGLGQTAYCCVYFYAAVGVWAGALFVAEGLLNCYTRCRGTLARAANMLCAGLAMALVAVQAFGLFCWLSGAGGNTLAVKRHCQWTPEVYRNCETALRRWAAYVDWRKEYADEERVAVQLALYVALFVCALTQFAIALRSTFRT